MYARSSGLDCVIAGVGDINELLCHGHCAHRVVVWRMTPDKTSIRSSFKFDLVAFDGTVSTPSQGYSSLLQHHIVVYWSAINHAVTSL